MFQFVVILFQFCSNYTDTLTLFPINIGASSNILVAPFSYYFKCGWYSSRYFFDGTCADFSKFFKFTIHPPPLRVKEPKKYLGTFRNFSGRPPLLLLKNSYFLRKWNKKKNSMILFKIFPKDPPPPTLSKKSCSSVYLHCKYFLKSYDFLATW